MTYRDTIRIVPASAVCERIPGGSWNLEELFGATDLPAGQSLGYAVAQAFDADHDPVGFYNLDAVDASARTILVGLLIKQLGVDFTIDETGVHAWACGCEDADHEAEAEDPIGLFDRDDQWGADVMNALSQENQLDPTAC